MPAFETLDPEIRGVLGKNISELGLRLEGSPVRSSVRQLYKELERRGLHKFRPVCYLTDEWGCPTSSRCSASRSTSPIRSWAGWRRRWTRSRDEREIMMYMRHEAGHVFNYAYRLYTRAEWRDVRSLSSPLSR